MMNFVLSSKQLGALLVILTLTSTAASPPPPRLSSAQLSRIGHRIWQNECDGKVADLTSWNTGEEFASLGIGHFIWYPKGNEGPFEESFPPLVPWLQAHGAKVPGWLLSTKDCPWSTRAAFMKDAQSARQKDLRVLLSETVREQTDYIIDRLNRTIPKLIAAGGAQVKQNYLSLSQSPEGMYAMIDYINFKGDGLNPKERYNKQGWGLAQVLGEMKGATPAEFANAAKRVLARRVKNSPPDRGEKRWLDGWSSRCDQYKQPL